MTCRPDETGYVLLAGGNTRLRAMLALYQETGDEAFRYLDCLFKPWVGESAVLLSHLRENELRDNLYFIDKARGPKAMTTPLGSWMCHWLSARTGSLATWAL